MECGFSPIGKASPFTFTRREGGTLIGGRVVAPLDLATESYGRILLPTYGTLQSKGGFPGAKDFERTAVEVYKKLNWLLMQHFQKSGEVRCQKPVK